MPANTLPSAIADAYKAAEIVGRESVGFINSVMLNTGSEKVALNAAVKSLKTEAPTLNTSVTPAMTIPEANFTLGQVANVMINITGEEQKTLDTHYSFETVHGNQFLQAFRKIRNAIESYLWGICYKGASRAIGTAGTTPFGNSTVGIDDIAEIRQIIFDNGYLSSGDMSLVLNSAAGTNLRQLAQLQKVNEAGGGDLLRNGELLNLQGFSIKESAGIGTHTKGNGTSYQLSAAEAVGSTTINVDTGSGTILTGDVITFTGYSDKYVVNTTMTGNAAVIGDPGIRVAVADDTAVTVTGNYTPNVGLNRMCVELAARPLAVPGTDAATDVIEVQDPLTGLTYEIREYSGFHKKMWSITVVYAGKVWHPQGVAILIG